MSNSATSAEKKHVCDMTFGANAARCAGQWVRQGRGGAEWIRVREAGGGGFGRLGRAQCVSFARVNEKCGERAK